MPLSRAAILAANDASIKAVAVPEWGGDVCIKVFNGTARDRVDAYISKSTDKDGKLVNSAGLRSLIIRLAACDESGSELFTDDDLATLDGKAATALNRIYTAACDLNGLSAKSREQAREDFFDGTSGASGSD